MNVASKDLCEELYKVSGWKDTAFCYYSNGGEVNGENVHYRDMVFDKPDNLPAYDLGYLMRKLPGDVRGGTLSLWKPGNIYTSGYLDKYNETIDESFCYGDTPEDAACKLAIELIKQGILKP